ncbi:XdhC family protein [Paenibacillus polygoni]|uniref:XdhC family protein n=1 Tax=Paenibacillus polygoni TaxID=3050112 RepID=A0ABY8WXE1_9BACL|nr:XdhC family protein [Paenibacillus polygoni]WIV17732.1 XdhC family protein [Paenibacillus polygoni]
MEMHDICEAALREGTQLVLATAVYVEGHAYRKEGVSMLFTEDGGMIGSLSPGCIETDLALRAEEVRRSGKPQLILYDMRPENDLSWGENIGCGGLLHILLEPVVEDLKWKLTQMKLSLDQGHTVTIRRKWNEQKREVHREIEKSENSLSTENDMAQGRYVHTYQPKPRLLIIGAGDDSITLAKLAASTGFRVTVADWREALCTESRFPNAALLAGFPEEILRAFQVREQDYLLLMSHQFPKERALLEQLQYSSYRYLGILGSRTRTSRLLEGLPPFLHLHTPVGLTIGSEGPEEIAVAITAELIAVKRNKTAVHDYAKGAYSDADSRSCARSGSKSAHG